MTADLNIALGAMEFGTRIDEVGDVQVGQVTRHEEAVRRERDAGNAGDGENTSSAERPDQAPLHACHLARGVLLGSGQDAALLGGLASESGGLYQAL